MELAAEDGSCDEVGVCLGAALPDRLPPRPMRRLCHARACCVSARRSAPRARVLLSHARCLAIAGR